MRRFQKILQAAWLALLLPEAVLSVVRGNIATSVLWASAWILLATSTLLLWTNLRPGLVMSAGISAVLLAFLIPWALLNVVAYVNREPLYADSPATIFVVLIVVAGTIMPAAVIFSLSVVNLRRAA